MWTKTLSCFLLVLFPFACHELTAQETKKSTGKPKSQTNASAQNAYLDRMRYLLNRDPRTSELTPAQVNNAINRIQNVFIKKEFPDSIRDTSRTRVGASHLRMIAQTFQQMVRHPDLEEVSGNRRSWYRKIGQDLLLLAPSLAEMDRAFTTQDNDRYLNARKEYETAVKQLEQTLKKPVKVPARELTAMKVKNIQRRKIEIQKEIQEMNKKRRTQG